MREKMIDDKYILKMEGIDKTFPGVHALDHVDFEVKRNEVLALVGENGAGKSTLIKIISGAYKPDGGTIYFNGEAFQPHNPIDSIEKGISVIYQELNYFSTLSIAENIYAGRLPIKKGRVDWKKLYSDAEEAMKEVGMNLDPGMLVEKLNTAQKQLIEIAKAVVRDSSLIIMDEPTAALSDTEVKALFNIIRQLREKNVSIVYISHRLEEVLEISDRVIVMRDGKRVAEMITADTNKQDLVMHMVGKDMRITRQSDSADYNSLLAHVSNLSAVSGNEKAENISFDIYKGEILGLFGLMGSGRTAVAEALFGYKPMLSGEFYMEGERCLFRSPKEAMQRGIGYISPERKVQGLALGLSVKSNIVMTILDKLELAKGFLFDKKKEDSLAREMIEKFNIKVSDPEHLIMTLSGGNQQKAIIAKWFLMNPKLLILNEPTRGIDIKSKSEVFSIIHDLRKEGMAVLLVSSELNEITTVSDRILVLHEGKQKKLFIGDEIDENEVMKVALGVETE